LCLGIEPQLTYSKMRKVILVTLILALTLPLQFIGAAVVLVGISLARRR
jgi:hypothetical protein